MDEIKFVTPDLIEKFFSKIKSIRNRALFSVMYHYGLRAGEVGLITLEDVDLNNNRIFIRALKNGISGQNLLSPQVKRHISTYLESERLKKRTLRKELFLSQKDHPITTTQIYRLFRTYAKKAKFPLDKQHPHTLRHSVAVHLAEAGLSVFEIKEHLRHRKVESTMVYFNLTNKSRMERQEQAFSNPMLAKI